MNKSFSPTDKHSFYQVWNDSVVIKDLIISILINVFLTTLFLYLSIYILSSSITDANIMRGYSLLIGLLGCILGAVICMNLFYPKRIIDSNIENNENLYSVIMSFVDHQSESSVTALPDSAKNELKALGLYDLFIRAEQKTLNNAMEDN